MTEAAKARIDAVINRIENMTFRGDIEGHEAFDELDKAVAAAQGVGVEVEIVPNVQEYLDGTKTVTYTRYWKNG